MEVAISLIILQAIAANLHKVVVEYNDVVEIQTATLWIFYGHPACNKRAGILFELYFTITLTMI